MDCQELAAGHGQLLLSFSLVSVEFVGRLLEHDPQPCQQKQADGPGDQTDD
jgi:hypothetical protein